MRDELCWWSGVKSTWFSDAASAFGSAGSRLQYHNGPLCLIENSRSGSDHQYLCFSPTAGSAAWPASRCKRLAKTSRLPALASEFGIVMGGSLMPTLIPTCTPSADLPTTTDDQRVEKSMKDDSQTQRDGDHDFSPASELSHHVSVNHQTEHGITGHAPTNPIYEAKVELTLLPLFLSFLSL